jgi:hypothetical protein
LTCLSDPSARKIVKGSVEFAARIKISKVVIVVKHLVPFSGKN